MIVSTSAARTAPDGPKQWTGFLRFEHVRVPHPPRRPSAASCDECGRNGHLVNHCFVRNDRALPASLSAEKRAAIEAKRTAYKMRMDTTMVAVETPLKRANREEDEDFIAKLVRLGV